MAKVKKFAEGKSVTDKFLDWATDKDTRSVMDIPKKDMRDPAYRKELERKQALKEPDISPEDIVIGPAKKAVAAFKAYSNAKKVGRVAPEIGSNVSRMVKDENPWDAIRKKADVDRASDIVEREGKESFKDRVRQQQQEEIQKEVQKQKQAASGRGGLKRESRTEIAPRNYGAASNLAMEAEDQANGLFNKPDTEYKKGGKVRSASARADGIAIRGKTRA